MNNLLLLVTAFVGIMPASATDVVLAPIETVEVAVVDTRAAKIDSYLESKGMPLAGYGKHFVITADKYGLDPNLLPAICVLESTCGKRYIHETHNPFGWGGGLIYFESIEDGIDHVGMNLAGLNPNTAKYYSTSDNYEKMYYYNGTVVPSYPSRILKVMETIHNTEV